MAIVANGRRRESVIILPGSLFQVLELTGYKLTSGADFKMFSVLAALSQRIVKLE